MPKRLLRPMPFTAVKADGSESFFSSTVQNNDRDHDGLTDADEVTMGTEISIDDTDIDGIPDGLEQAYNTDPLVEDSDGDGYLDGIEVETEKDPLSADDFPVIHINPDGQCNGLQLCYTSIEGGMNAAGKTAHIKVLQGSYAETLVFSASSSCLFQGGYNSGYLSNSGANSRINGSLIISKGALEVENIILASP